MSERPGVLLYWDTFDILENLLDGEAKAMMSAIKNYARYGEKPNFAGDRLLSTLWLAIRQRIDADEQRYKDICVKRAEAGKKGAEKKHFLASEANATKCQQVPASEANATKCRQNKPITVTNSNSNSITESNSTKRFVPPTLEEVREYCLERGNSIDPERFVDYYTANGWVQSGGKKIKDWMACVRNWERNDLNSPKVEQPKDDPYSIFNNF